MKLRASRNFFCVAALAFVASCANDATPEQQVRDVITRAEQAAEARDVSDLAALVSDDYSGERGFDKRELTNYVRGYLLLHPSVNLMVRIHDVEFPAERLARAEVTVGMLGSRGESEELAADLQTFDLQLLNEDGTWRLIRADRQRSP